MTGTLTDVVHDTDTHEPGIRPFEVNVLDAEVADLNGRVKTTRWPDRETVTMRCR